MSRTVPGEAGYVSGVSSFAAGLRPSDAARLTWPDTLDLLRRRFGNAVDLALSEEATDPAVEPGELVEEIRSPRSAAADSSWLRRSNMAGINVRTVGDYTGVVKYALTLPSFVDSIHLLPIWEPGAVGSLYGIASWNLNTEFVSTEMSQLASYLDTPDRQLRAIANLIHVMGKSIGMDVIPHTDRFSEPTLANPELFEWMRIEGRQIVDVGDAVTGAAIDVVRDWYATMGPADLGAVSVKPSAIVPAAVDTADLFAVDEPTRLMALFGDPADRQGRIDRRVSLLRHLKSAGLEPVPATMGVPYRGIQIDPDPNHVVTDDGGLEWPDFIMLEPEHMSRVFSPLTRFHLYEAAEGSVWELDFDRPRHHVWDYVCRRYADAQRIGAFDFMRGDMSHVQMRPTGVPDTIDSHYDILGAVKQYIATESGTPWFGYFAESFLPARDVFQYGEELDHLEASQADTTLGDLQSTPVGSREFLRVFRRYLDDLGTRRTAPSYTVMTADKDDPRFDEFYLDGNEARMFTALFLPDMPSYTGLGFELRDRRTEPAENERYTKLFVFEESGDSNIYPSKARFGDVYQWGSNDELFWRLTTLKVFAEGILPLVAERTTRWLIPPDATGLRGTAAWVLDASARGEETFVFVVNYDLGRPSGYFGLPALEAGTTLFPEFSTLVAPIDLEHVEHNGFFHRIENLEPGEARVYRIEAATRDP